MDTSDEIEGDSISERYTSLLDRGSHTDLKIFVKKQHVSEGEVQDVRQFNVHRIILIATSTVFEGIIRCLGRQATLLILYEENPDVFHILVDFAYRHTVDLSGRSESEVNSLIRLAYKYKIQELLEYCGSYMQDNSQENEFALINTAAKYNIESLKESSSRLLKKYPKTYFSLSEFNSITPKAMSYIVQQKAINIESEMELFLAVMRWAESYLGLKNYKTFLIPPNDPQQPIVEIKQSVPYGLASIENKITKIFNISLTEYIDNQVVRDKTIVYPRSKPAKADIWTGELISDLSETSKEYGLKIRNFLVDKNILKHIRFLTMDHPQFCQHILHRNILTYDEIQYIMMYLNASVISTPAPETMCEIPTPREEFDPDLTVKERICTVYVTLMVITPKYLEVKASTQFKEYFYCASERPICLESVLMPPKKRMKHCKSARFDEEMIVELDVVNEDGSKISTVARSRFKGKRRYDFNREFKFVYNFNDAGTMFKRGMHFSVGVTVKKTASYLGGFQYDQLCIDNDFIQVSKEKQKGIIQKIGFSFHV